jgi:hypothetical protein
VTAIAAVTRRLRRLQTLSPTAFEAVLARQRLIASDPSHPRSRGASFESPGGPIVHAVVVATPELEVRIAWVLLDDEIRLIGLEFEDADEVS